MYAKVYDIRCPFSNIDSVKYYEFEIIPNQLALDESTFV